MAPDWSVESLRVSIFSDRFVQVTDDDWRRLTGQDVSQLRQGVPNGIVYSGVAGDANLTVSSVGPRIDIVLSGASNVPVEEVSFATIEKWEPARTRFVEFTTRWLEEKTLSVFRIAFGAALMYRTANAEESLAKLRDMLVSANIEEGMRDPLFRVNWPQTSSVVDGLVLNRITTWSAIHVALPQFSATTPPVPDLHAVRLEIDHNSDPRHTASLNPGCIMGIYAELVEMASENAARGERP